MFSGIISDLGQFNSLTSADDENFLCSINAKTLADKLKIGDSVACDGTCLTVINIEGISLFFDISFTTAETTIIKNYNPGDIINLERALSLDARLDGHIVQGHVDGVAQLEHIKIVKESRQLKFSIPAKIAKYVCTKGSVAINGVSLTVVAEEKNSFTTTLVPYTLAHTNLNNLKQGDLVNIETDILGRYIEKLLKSRQDSPKAL